MKSALISPLLAGLLLLTGCAQQPAAQAGGGGGGTINHQPHKMGNQPLQYQRPVGHRFNRPVSGGGGGAAQRARPLTPGMTVRVDWETGVGDMEGFRLWAMMKVPAWAKKMKAQNRQHSTNCSGLPDYNGQDACGITVHFYPAMP